MTVSGNTAAAEEQKRLDDEKKAKEVLKTEQQKIAEKEKEEQDKHKESHQGLTAHQLLEKQIKDEKEKVSKSLELEKGIKEQAAKENEDRLRSSMKRADNPPATDFNSPEAVKSREELAKKQAMPTQHPEIDATQKPGTPFPGAEKSGALSSANETPASKLDRIALVLKNSGADSMGQLRGLQAIKEILGY